MEVGSPAAGSPAPVLGLRRLSFAYQGLLEIPYEGILEQRDTLEVLDLSYNLLEEYPLLCLFPRSFSCRNTQVLCCCVVLSELIDVALCYLN